jgi:hypothetical protein
MLAHPSPPMWHVYGAERWARLRPVREKRPDLGWSSGAGDRDRTGMTSLEGCEPQRAGLLLPRSGLVAVSP